MKEALVGGVADENWSRGCLETLLCWVLTAAGNTDVLEIADSGECAFSPVPGQAFVPRGILGLWPWQTPWMQRTYPGQLAWLHLHGRWQRALFGGWCNRAEGSLRLCGPPHCRWSIGLLGTPLESQCRRCGGIGLAGPIWHPGLSCCGETPDRM